MANLFESWYYDMNGQVVDRDDQEAKALGRGLKRSLGMDGQTKAVDVLDATYTMSTTPSFTLVNSVRPGYSFNNRVGRTICLKSLVIKGLMKYVNTSVQGGRILVVYDKQSNGTQPQFSDIMQSCDEAGTVQFTMTAQYNINNRDRFVILYDRIYGKYMLVTPTIQESLISTKIDLENLQTQYMSDSAPTTIADVATGALWFITCGDRASATDTFYGSLRLRFTDN